MRGEPPGARPGPNAMGGHPHPYQPPQRPRQEIRDWQRQAGWRRQGGWPEHRTWQEHRAQHWANEHRTWQQRGGYGGAFIPRDRYYRHFGPDHFFRIRQRPTIYMGYPRFQYGGYGFIFVDPWPEYWSDTWYQDDQVYVEYEGDGYYLYNARYPGVAIAITVVD